MTKPITQVLILLMTLLVGSLSAQAAVTPADFPTLYINTTDNAAVTSKDTYLTATYWLDNAGDTSIKAIGSESAPLSLQIKGRGNYTWTGFDKKPYRLKLDKKAALMGMTSSKHFALLAHADDIYAFLRNTVGFELSRRLDMAWTPEAAPVQLVLNGDYKGLYFLTETIRVDSDRVNIVEQPDNATDPDVITGGWLVEIDNYDTDPHIEIKEGNGKRIVFTYKTPEELSTQQKDYLTAQMKAVNTAIYATDKTSTDWESLVDIDALARYYIVQEILDDCESFHGSCYLYRQQGANSKWTFGPVWDFGNAFSRTTKKFIFDDPAFNQTWIGEIYKFPNFQAKVKEIWQDFIDNDYEDIYEGFIDKFIARISDAAAADLKRWPSYGQKDLEGRAATFKSLMQKSVQFLCKNWGGVYQDVETVYLRGTFNNWSVKNPMSYDKSSGNYYLDNVTLSGEFKIATEDWNTIDLGSNGERMRLNTPYKLVTSGPNITCRDTVKNATFVFNPTDSTLTISSTSSVDGITTGDCEPTIAGRDVVCAMPFSVYTLSGVQLFGNVTSATLPSAGTYIIATPSGATKVLVR